MQVITRSTANTLVFTLTELVTLTTPYFLFELKCSQNGITKYFISANTSSYTYRYDKFTVTEVELASEALTTGSVNLPYVGEYYYRIWEQSSSTNLNPANTTTLLEQGIIRVLETASATNQYSGNSLEYTQYNIPL